MSDTNREYIVDWTVVAGIEEEATNGELTRCKDCHWWNVIVRQDDTTPPKGYCGCYHGVHFGDWYCADGERRRDT